MKLLVYSHSNQHLSDELKEYILANFDGLYIDNQLEENKSFGDMFDPDKCMLSIITKWYKEVSAQSPQYKLKYMDEPFATKFEGDKNNKWISCNVPGQIEEYELNHTIGELTDEAFNTLYGYNCHVTFTAYRRRLFTIFGYRIYWELPFFFRFATPIKHWEDLELQFEDRFKMVWVHCFKNAKYAKQLIEWAKKYNKEIWIYAGINTWGDENVLKRYLEIWTSAELT